MTNIPLPDLGKFRKELDGLKPQLDQLEEIQSRAFRAYRLVCDLEVRPKDFQELRRKAQEAVEATAQDSAQIRDILGKYLEKEGVFKKAKPGSFGGKWVNPDES